MNRTVTIRLARYGIPATIAAVVVAGMWLYTFTYFWLDDFNNVYWIRREGFWRLIGDILNPASLFFRPLGMLVYWIVFRVAALHSLPYHLLSWALHSINTGLVFFLLRRLTKSQYAAGFAVLFFAFRANHADIYWSFANIFQLLALGLMLAGLLLYDRFGYSMKETLALTAILVLAIRAEEHGVVLPILWFGYEWLIRRTLNWRRLWLRYAIFTAVMAWFTYFKLTTMHDIDPTRPYYLDLSVLTFGRGYGWYFNSLYQTNLRWGGWFTISALLAILFAIRKNRRAVFFMLFTYVTLLPYVFLVNHRFELYSYMPFVGVAGLLGLGVNAIQKGMRQVLSRPVAAAALSVLFLAAAVGHFSHEEHRGRPGREYFRDVFGEYRSFLIDLRTLPDAGTVPILYYTALPRHMDEGTVFRATEFALDRIDVETKVVENCPAEGACIAFENGRLRRIQ